MTDFHLDNQPNDVILVITTVPNDETSQALSRSLVDDELAACVHALPGGTSTYRWEGRVHTDREHTLFIKTVREHGDAVARRVHDTHPYELPELLVIPIHGGSVKYLDWVRQQVAAATPPPGQ